MDRRSTTTKVFVGSVPPNATVEELKKLFSPYGVISECDIANRCGFLHLEDKDMALKAIEELNNTQFMGSRITVEMGRMKPRRGVDGGGGKMMRGGMNSMRRDTGPYSRDYGNRGGPPGRPGGYDQDFYSDRNADRSYNSYGTPYYGDMSQSPVGYNSRYSLDNRRPATAYQPSHGYSTGTGGASTMAGGYSDNRRMGAGTAMYDDRGRTDFGQLAERRPQAVTQGMPPSNRMDSYGMDYSRRDSGQPKQLMAVGGYGDRSGSGHVAGGGYPSYSSSQNGSGGYQSSYGDSRQTSSSGYDTHSAYGSSAGAYGSTPSAGYASAVQLSTAGGYGDAYGQRGNYDNAYPALPQQRSGYATSYEQPPNYHY